MVDVHIDVSDNIWLLLGDVPAEILTPLYVLNFIQIFY